MRTGSPHLLVVLGLVILVGGCVIGGPTPTDAPSPMPATDSPTDTRDPGTATSTMDGHAAAENQPHAAKEVRIENAWNDTVAVRVRVIREATNETVHLGTYDVVPGGERTVYNVSAADPDGIEAFTTVVTARNSTERVTIETNRCFGNVYAEIQADGGLYVYYVIC